MKKKENNLFKEIKQIVVSTTGTKLTEQDIALILYLANKKETND